MRPLGLGVALAGLAMVAAVMLAARSGVVGGEAPGQTVAEVVQAAPADAQPPQVFHPVPARARPVASDLVSPPPVAQDRLERVAERAPLSPIGRAHAPSEGPPKPTILYRPVVVAAGLFQAQGHTVALAAIEVFDQNEACGDGSAAWPCGVHARTAFRNWLRGRALTCVVPPVPASGTVVSDCTLGGHNPAEWLVSNGWAKAAPDGPYAQLEAAARAAGRGIFGSAPATAMPMPALVAPSDGG